MHRESRTRLGNSDRHKVTIQQVCCLQVHQPSTRRRPQAGCQLPHIRLLPRAEGSLAAAANTFQVLFKLHTQLSPGEARQGNVIRQVSLHATSQSCSHNPGESSSKLASRGVQEQLIITN